MEMTTTVYVLAEPEPIFRLAADIARWPAILPHYRYVRVLEDDGVRRVAEMSAWRDVIPVRWKAVETLHPDRHAIAFKHVGGVTRGMEVEWRLTPVPGGLGTMVSIWHRFEPRRPIVPDALVDLVIGRFFVDAIAGKTLRRIKMLVEDGGAGAGSGLEGR